MELDCRSVREELSPAELALHDSFTSTTERDLFRILRNFARLAARLNRPDFAFPLEHVASRLGVTFQYVSKLRRKFAAAGVISQMAAARVNSAATRFRWCVPGLLPEVDGSPRNELAPLGDLRQR